LRRGGRYHKRMRGARFVGATTTQPRFTMLDLGLYPGVIAVGQTAIRGEVYAATHQHIARLDLFEDHPHEYERVALSTEFGNAWIYLYRRADPALPVVHSGDWLTYVSSGSRRDQP